jgi:hypothetical protein
MADPLPARGSIEIDHSRHHFAAAQVIGLRTHQPHPALYAQRDRAPEKVVRRKIGRVSCDADAYAGEI